MKNILVENLSHQTTDVELKALFQQYGAVGRVQITTDRVTGRSRGVAFVEMPNDEEAANAIAALNGKDMGGRALSVNDASPKPEKTMFKPGGGAFGSGRPPQRELC